MKKNRITIVTIVILGILVFVPIWTMRFPDGHSTHYNTYDWANTCNSEQYWFVPEL